MSLKHLVQEAYNCSNNSSRPIKYCWLSKYPGRLLIHCFMITMCKIIKLFNLFIGQCLCTSGDTGEPGPEVENVTGEPEPGVKGDRSHLVVWQVALPHSKLNPSLLF